jgi:hypothetical protein
VHHYRFVSKLLRQRAIVRGQFIELDDAMVSQFNGALVEGAGI